MIAVVLAIGNFDYKMTALSIIRQYYDHFNIPFYVLAHNDDRVLEEKYSLNKMLIHDIYESDFILVHDCDLLPCNVNQDIRDYIDESKFNLAVDAASSAIMMEYDDIRYFHYNCGMIGIPKSKAEFCERVFWKKLCDYAALPGCEQYPFNIEIAKNNERVHVLPSIFNRYYEPNFDYEESTFCHYTYTVKHEDKLRTIEENHPKEIANVPGASW